MYYLIKRMLDFIFGSILLVLLSPIMIIIAILIKIDSKGSFIFKQNRLGKNGKHFTMFKFRTMLVNAEKMGTGLDSYKNDPRVTKIGRILRNTTFDELPQLFNIIKGNMSFVGPRPPVTYHPYKYRDYDPVNKRRFLVTPGVTGYAQIHGRNELPWNEKFKYDLYYIDNISFILDVKIFILSIFKVIKMEGSHDLKNNNLSRQK